MKNQNQEKLKELENKIEELDRKVNQIQRSTATKINTFLPIHNQLRMKSKLYYNWHLNPKVSFIHLIVLIIYIIIVIVSSFYFAVYPYKLTKAATDYSKLFIAEELNVQPTSKWYFRSYYDPYGMYLTSFLPNDDMPIDGQVKLDTTIPPGNYKLFFSGNHSGSVDITLGGVTQNMQIPGVKSGEVWTTLEFQTTTETDVVDFKFFRTLPLSEYQYYSIQGLFITTNVNEFVTNDFRVIDLHYPAPEEMDTATAIKGNYLENSSFEISNSHGWGLADGYRKVYPLGYMLDSLTAVHGSYSVKLPLDLSILKNQVLLSKSYKVRPNRKYTFSAYMRSDTTTGVTIQVRNTFESDPEFGTRYALEQRDITVTNSWQRFSFSGDLINYPYANYQIKVIPQSQSQIGKSLWIDAIQLEEGELSDYNPAVSVEIGLTSDHEGNVFYEDEPVLMKFLAYNNGSTAKTITTRYEIYDYYNQKVKSGSINLNLSSGLNEQQLDLTPGKRGAFRVVLWVEEMAKTLDEKIFSVLPRPKTLNIDEQSSVGGHIAFDDYPLSLMQKTGVKWTRTLSSEADLLRWGLVEQEKGNFIWHDDRVVKPAQHGTMILGTLGTNDYWPDWAEDPSTGLPILSDFYDYVYAMVSHYKNYITYWEIWNEPDGAGIPAEYYADMLKTGYEAVKAADPNAKVLGMVGALPPYTQQVIDALVAKYGSADYFDILAIHQYAPGDRDLAWLQIANQYNKPVWGTEAGMSSQTFYQTLHYEDIDFPRYRPTDYKRNYPLRTEMMTTNFAQTMGANVEGNSYDKYFYYDTKMTGGPDQWITWSLFEYDGTLRPKGVAYSVLANLFDGAKGQGDLNLDSNVGSYLFQREETPLVILWTKDRGNKVLTSDLSFSDLKVYDVMGNLISVDTNIQGELEIPFGASPVYLEGQGINKNALVLSIKGIASKLDTTAPVLSMATWPTGPVNTNSVHLRWFALDDISVSTSPNLRVFTSFLYTDQILYSHQLEDYESTWSDWTPLAYKIYSNLPNGTYTFQVKAKDAAGNESEVKSVDIIIGTGEYTAKITTVKNEQGDYNFYSYNSPEGSQACDIQDSDLWNIPDGNNVIAQAFLDGDKIGVIKNEQGDYNFYLYNAPQGQEAATQIGADYWNIPGGNNIVSIAGLDSDGDSQDELAVLKNENGDHNLYIYELPSGDEAKSKIASDLWNIPFGNNVISICGINIQDSGSDKIAVLKNESGDHNLYIYDAPTSDQACTKIASDLWNIPDGNNVISIAGIDYSRNGRKDKIAVLKNNNGDYDLYVYNLPSTLLTPASSYGQDLWNIPGDNNIVDLGG